MKILAWIALGLIALLRPRTGEALASVTKRAADRLARRPLIACIATGLAVLLLRAMLMPFEAAPRPTIYDEFAYLLQADTFAHGHLTAATHKLWPFFESPHVLQHPTYAARYPPGQSLALAAGQALFGDPWFGVWLSCGVMAAALMWALQAWLPSRQALLGGLLLLPLASSSYWMNSYWGGAVAATGGALVLGGYARVARRGEAWFGAAMGLGLAILANTRPYEGLVFSLPVMWMLVRARGRWRALAALAMVLTPALAMTGIYNHAVTGDALRMPYTEYGRQYARIPLFTFQSLQPAKSYRTAAMADLHEHWEPEQWAAARSAQLIRMRLSDWAHSGSTITGSGAMAMAVVLLTPWMWRDRRVRLPLICVAAAMAGSLVEIRYYVHYAAPAAAALLIVAVQALRHLRQWRPQGKPAGRFLAWSMPVLAVSMALAAPVVAAARHELPENARARNYQRSGLEAAVLEADPAAKHLIVVRYTGNQSPHEEWVYNSSDIDGQDVIWAHDLGATENAALLTYYKDRKVWLLEPDVDPTKVLPYDGAVTLRP